MLKKIKNSLIGIAIFLVTWPMKIWAHTDLLEPSPMYGVKKVKKALTLEIIFDWLKMIIIPIIFLIGIIIYFRKKEDTNLKKSMIRCCILELIVIIMFFALVFQIILI